MLETLIKSKTRRKLLTVFIFNPDSKFYIRELERLIKEPVSAVRRELQTLENSGFLLSQQEARVKYYVVNKDYPILEEIKKIILKTQGIADHLRKLMKRTPGIRVAFIYGSVAEGDSNAASDIDLMVIGDIDIVKLHAEINEVEEKIRRTINYNLISEKDFKNKKTAFIKRVLNGKKIFIIGKEDEFRELG